MSPPLLLDPFLLVLTLFYRRDTRTVVKRTSNSAYPKVVSNLGALMDTSKGRVAVNMIRFMNCYARSIVERARIIAFFKEDRYVMPVVVEAVRQGGGLDLVPLPGMDAFKEEVQGVGIGTKDMMGMMNDYFAVGYANTVGYAHPNTGDTMTSVMIGGLRTVMNGDFEIFPGDLVQFYWCVVLTRFQCFVLANVSGAGPLRRTTSCPAGAASRTSTSGTGTRRATWTPPPCQTAAPVGP